MPWILGSPSADALLILFPGILWALLFPFAPDESAVFGALAFFALAVVDSGHVYTTIWRTYFRKEERSSSRIYWILPLCIVALMSLWFALGLPYAWTFIIYATVFHHFRQYYGILRWYERLNGHASRVPGFFLYALTFLPFLLLHVRPEPALREIMLYGDNDIFLMPNERLWRLGLGVMAVLWSSWAGYEASQWVEGKRESNRLLAVFAPAALSAFCFLWARDIRTMILPLLINHGIPYFAVLGLSLRRLEPKRFATLGSTAGLVLITAAGFGALEWLVEQNLLYIDNGYVTYSLGPTHSLLLALYLVPLLSHYVLDAYLWTGRHREAKIVYAKATL